jgi:hypothetical protein
MKSYNPHNPISNVREIGRWFAVISRTKRVEFIPPLIDLISRPPTYSDIKDVATIKDSAFEPVAERDDPQNPGALRAAVDAFEKNEFRVIASEIKKMMD